MYYTESWLELFTETNGGYVIIDELTDGISFEVDWMFGLFGMKGKVGIENEGINGFLLNIYCISDKSY